MNQPSLIGRVTRSSTLGFVGAIRLPEPDLPTFGAFCSAEAQRGQSHVIGLIYDIAIEDDELARQMARAEVLPPEETADAQWNRQVPIEVSALALGYRDAGRYIHTLPPQPPLTLSPIHALTEKEVVEFTERLDFLPLLLAAPNLPVDDMLAAALRAAAQARPASERRPFLLQACRAAARLMAGHLVRLENLVQGLRRQGEMGAPE